MNDDTAAECKATAPQTPPATTFDFGHALSLMRAGAKMRRIGWNGPNQHVALQHPTYASKMTLPYLFITTAQGACVPWLASQTDLLSVDWAFA